jgi:hypothetical protein
MEKQKLPNATAVLTLGILSILTCCCYGVIGLVLGIIAIVLANKDMKLYNENPDIYDGYSNINTGKILAIIGIVLSAIYFMANIYLWVFVGEAGIKDFQQNLIEKMKQQQED